MASQESQRRPSQMEWEGISENRRKTVQMIGGRQYTIDGQALDLSGKVDDAPITKYKTLVRADKYISAALMLGMVVIEALFLMQSIYRVYASRSALSVMELAATSCSFIVALIAVLIWHIYCFYEPWMRTLLKRKTRFTPKGSMMAGFVPIPASASVGLLLFVTQCLVAPTIVQGSNLLIDARFHWTPTHSCTASAIEPADYQTRWGAGWDKQAPYQRRHQLTKAFKDFLTGAADQHTKDLQSQIKELDQNPNAGECFRAGKEFGKADAFQKDIVNLNTPYGDTSGNVCMYVCAKWNVNNFQSVIKGIGIIFAGAAIVVQATSAASDKLGLETVTQKTTAVNLDALLDKIRPDHWLRALTKPLQHSRVVAALPTLAIGAFLKYYLIVKIDKDGYDTVDYYVTYVMLFAAALVIQVRQWNTYEMSPNIFPRKLWTTGAQRFCVKRSLLKQWNLKWGENEFTVQRVVGADNSTRNSKANAEQDDDLVVTEVDLYQWVHLSQEDRAHLLINLCRRPTPELQPGTALVIRVSCQVDVEHEHNVTSDVNGQYMVRSHKQCNVQKGQAATLVKFLNDGGTTSDLGIDGKLIIRTMIDGAEEEVIVQKQCVFEADTTWYDMMTKYDLHKHEGPVPQIVDAEAPAPGSTEMVAPASTGKGLTEPLLPNKMGNVKGMFQSLETRLNALEGSASRLLNQ